VRLLHDRTALVTGGGGGLGRAYAVALARAGAAVAVCDVDESAAEQTAAAVTRDGGRAIAIRADVTRAVDVEDAIECVETTLGPLDVLLNLAGTFPKNALVDLPEEEWDAVIALNLKSVFLGSRAAIRRMLPRRRGVVLSAASGTTVRGVPRGPLAPGVQRGLKADVARKLGLSSPIRCYAVTLGNRRGSSGMCSDSTQPGLSTQTTRSGRLAESASSERSSTAILRL
jgi:2,3-dihydro-2,3-dihydroxybenzoate dehydrogenase